MKVFSSTLGSDPTSRVKALALKLRSETPGIKHGHALKVVSVFLGFKDWNTLSALLKTDPLRVEELLNKYEAKGIK